MKTGIKRTISIFCVLSIIAFTIGTIIAAGYTVNQSDDFYHAVEVGVYHVGFLRYLWVSIGYMIDMYKNWAGNYFSMFLQGLLSPLNSGGAIQLRLVMISNAVLFFASFIWLLWCFFEKISDKLESWVKLLLIIAIIYPLMSYRCYYEIFYWFSGATSYSFPMVFMFLSLIMMLKKKYTPSCICAFLAAGGSLNIAGVACYIVLLVCVFEWLNDKKIERNDLVLFGVYLVGTIINVIAPGNYVRSESGGEQLGVLTAVNNTIYASYGEVRWLFHDTNFIVVIFEVAIIVLLFSKRFEPKLGKKIKKYLIVSVLALFTPVVSIFPVVLGYNMNYLANRTQLMIEISLILAFINFAVVISLYVSSWKRDIKQSVWVLLIASICMICLNSFEIRQHQWLRTDILALNGTFLNYYRECAELEHFWESCEGQDVEVDPSVVPEAMDNFSCLYLENGWVNQGIADYYRMNSLVLKE